MERRNFLGIAALFGLAPLLPKINVEEQEQVKALGKPFTPELWKDNLVLDDTFKIKVYDNEVTIYMPDSENDSLLIIGKGTLNDNPINFEMEVNQLIDPPKAFITIDKIKKYEVIQYDMSKPYVYIESEPVSFSPAIIEITCKI